MTISTLSFQQNAVNQMDALEQALSKTQTQLSTGTTLQSAADDPVAMTQVDTLNNDLSASKQYVTNGNLANSNLTLEQQALTSATNTLQSSRDLLVEANNASLSASQRQDIATELQQQLQALVATANSQDTEGNYLFSGTASATQPFSQNGTTVSYAGASEVNQVQLSAEQSISTGDTGSSVFMNLPGGNGTITTAAAAANTGGASISPGTLTNPSAWVAGNYTVTFTSGTQYQVTNSGGGVVASGSYAASDGGTFSITFNGAQLSFSGVPATGDSFTVASAGIVSAFSTLASAISTLQSGTLNSAQIASQLNTLSDQLDGAMNSLDQVQASVGARMNAISAASTTATSEQTAEQTEISSLSDTDYAQATTQLSTEELALQAAQESYASMEKLSLFNYLQ